MATRQPKNLQKEIRWLIEEKYGGKETRETAKDIARLEKGEHVDYVIGWVDFAGCRIDLSKRPLIPRSETEYWTEKAIEEIQTVASRTIKFSSRFTPEGPYASRKISSFSRRPRVLDIFAGSGCIGVAVLRHIPGARVDFGEQKKKLLKQIAINAKLNRIDTKRYRVFQSDIFSNIKGKFDYIFANPPYVAEARKTKVQKSVLDQEPRNAVFGGKDGLYYIRKFLKGVGDFLVPGGVVYLEFDSHQKTEIAKLAKAAGAKEVGVQKDQFDKWRYARVVF